MFSRLSPRPPCPIVFSESTGSIFPLRVRPVEFARFGALWCEFEALLVSIAFSESTGSIFPLRVRPTEFERFGALRCEFGVLQVWGENPDLNHALHPP